MIGYHPTLTAGLAAEHRRDLLREAALSGMIADLPDRDRHRTPRQHPSWWSHVTSFVGHRAAPAGA